MNNNYQNNDLIKIKISKGDATALEQLYRKYFKKLKLYGLQFSQKLNTYSIDDTIQELFIWIAKNPQALKNVDDLEVYLFSALKQNVYQGISKREIRKKVKHKYLQSTLFDKEETSVENNYIQLEENTINNNSIAHLLNTLPPNQKEVIYLRNYVNMSYQKIAQVMDLSEQVVRNYSYRAVQSLRKKATPKKRQSNG